MRPAGRRHAEQQVERDRRADELGQVGRHRDELGLDPQAPGDRPREVLAAQLGQVAPGGDADLRRQVLDQHRHQVGGEQHPEQQVAELRAAGDVRGEVAGVDVGDAGDERRAEDREGPADAPAGRMRSSSLAVGARRRRGAASAAASSVAASGVTVDLDAHRLRERAAEHVGLAAEAGEHRPAERLLLDDLEAVARRDAALAEVAQHLGVGSEMRMNTPLSPTSSVHADGCALVDRELRRGDRVAVRVVRRVPELGRDQRLELLGDDVLEDLRLVVHAVPRHVEPLGEVQLEQPVVAEHLERDALAVGGQLHAAVRLVADEAERPQLLDHAGGRRGSPRAAPRAFGRHGGVAAPLERVDRLGVVLDGLAGPGASLHSAHQGYGTPKSQSQGLQETCSECLDHCSSDAGPPTIRPPILATWPPTPIPPAPPHRALTEGAAVVDRSSSASSP